MRGNGYPGSSAASRRESLVSRVHTGCDRVPGSHRESFGWRSARAFPLDRESSILPHQLGKIRENLEKIEINCEPSRWLSSQRIILVWSPGSNSNHQAPRRTTGNQRGMKESLPVWAGARRWVQEAVQAVREANPRPSSTQSEYWNFCTLHVRTAAAAAVWPQRNEKGFCGRSRRPILAHITPTHRSHRLGGDV